MPFKKHSKRKRGNLLSRLTSKQLKHLTEFGEAHPADFPKDDGKQVQVKRVYDKETSVSRDESISVDDPESSENEEASPFGQLLTSFENRKQNEIETEDSSDMDDQDHEESKSSAILEAEETYNSENDEESSDEDEQSQNSPQDLFHFHFEVTVLPEEQAFLLARKDNWTTQEIVWPHMGRLIVKEAIGSGFPKCPSLKKHTSVQEHQLKNRLIENLPKTLHLDKKKHADKMSPLQLELLSVVSTYRDLYFPNRTFDNAEDLRLIYTLHSVNHILKTRSKIIHHNSKIKQNCDGAQEYRDQGLTRTKVLIVLPFKEAALRVVNLIISLVFPEGKENVMNKKRFQQEYGSEDERKQSTKPADYEALFAGNIDDAFRIGIAITKKSLRLYSDFYSADIIIASPLGLRTIIGAEGEKGRDFDFLSSIEVLIFDQTDVFLMQNWEHVLHLVQHLHLQPQNSHGVDFSRVRMWCLESLSKYYRQTLIFSSFNAPPLLALFNKHCLNYNGGAVVCNPISPGSVSQVVIQLPQVFHRFETCSIHEAPEDRFTFFVQKILPQFKDPLMSHTMIFVPSYFDFVRLRNYFKREEISFAQICEYSKPGKIAKARDMFFHGARHFLLYTERCHFYRRYRIKGVRHIIFYELPLYSHFYSELCNFLHPSMRRQKRDSAAENVSCTVLYCYLNVHQLAGVVGTSKSSLMINSEKKVHMFVTSDV